MKINEVEEQFYKDVNSVFQIINTKHPKKYYHAVLELAKKKMDRLKEETYNLLIDKNGIIDFNEMFKEHPLDFIECIKSDKFRFNYLEVYPKNKTIEEAYASTLDREILDKWHTEVFSKYDFIKK